MSGRKQRNRETQPYELGTEVMAALRGAVFDGETITIRQKKGLLRGGARELRLHVRQLTGVTIKEPYFGSIGWLVFQTADLPSAPPRAITGGPAARQAAMRDYINAVPFGPTHIGRFRGLYEAVDEAVRANHYGPAKTDS